MQSTGKTFLLQILLHDHLFALHLYCSQLYVKIIQPKESLSLWWRHKIYIHSIKVALVLFNHLHHKGLGGIVALKSKFW